MGFNEIIQVIFLIGIIGMFFYYLFEVVKPLIDEKINMIKGKEDVDEEKEDEDDEGVKVEYY